MNIQRTEDFDGVVWYRIYGDYPKDSLALLPSELLQLMFYLNEHAEQLRAEAFHEPEQARRQESYPLEEGGTLNDPTSPPE